MQLESVEAHVGAARAQHQLQGRGNAAEATPMRPARSQTAVNYCRGHSSTASGPLFVFCFLQPHFVFQVFVAT
jgi:hypothetical protein